MRSLAFTAFLSLAACSAAPGPADAGASGGTSSGGALDAGATAGASGSGGGSTAGGASSSGGSSGGEGTTGGSSTGGLPSGSSSGGGDCQPLVFVDGGLCDQTGVKCVFYNPKGQGIPGACCDPLATCDVYGSAACCRRPGNACAIDADCCPPDGGFTGSCVECTCR